MITDKSFQDLERSIEWSTKQLEFSRKKYREAILMSVGAHYSDGGADKKVPVDFIKLIERVYARLLAPQAPRAQFLAQNKALRATAYTMELVLQQIVTEIGFDDTLRRAVHEAMYAPWGVVKVGTYHSQDVLGYKYGRIFADNVTWDDFFCDMSAKLPNQMQYEGNDYWMGYDDFMESDYFENKRGNNIKADEYTLVSEHGGNAAQSIGTDGGGASLYKKKIWLRDVWLPDERVMVTYGVTSKKIFKQVELDEDVMPEASPYHKLGYDSVCGGNLLPLPPVALWRDIHEMENTLFRKMARGADAQKRVAAFGQADDKDIENLRDANDGDGIRYTGQSPVALDLGGIDQKTLAFFMHAKDLLSWSAGNIDALGGLSPMTDTVGQERLLTESANAMLKDMASKTIEFVRGVYRSMAKYEWDNPLSNRVVEKEIPETDMKIPTRWTPNSKNGSFDEYSLKVDVYSLQDNTPSARLQKMQLFLERFVAPLQPFIQQQGGIIDVQKIINEAVRCMGMPELDELVQFMEPAPEDNAKEAATQSGNTTRTYERVNRPGATQQGKENVMKEILMGGNPQGSEQAMLNRSTG